MEPFNGPEIVIEHRNFLSGFPILGFIETHIYLSRVVSCRRVPHLASVHDARNVIVKASSLSSKSEPKKLTREC